MHIGIDYKKHIYTFKKYKYIVIFYAWFYECSSLNRGHCWVVLPETLTPPPPLADCSYVTIMRVYCIYIYIYLCICAHTDACTYYYFYYYHYYNIGGKSSRRVCARTRILTAYTHTRTNMHRYTHTQARALHRTETTSLEYFNSL